MFYNSGPVYFTYLFVSLYVFSLLRTVDTSKSDRNKYMKYVLIYIL